MEKNWKSIGKMRNKLMKLRRTLGAFEFIQRTLLKWWISAQCSLEVSSVTIFTQSYQHLKWAKLSHSSHVFYSNEIYCVQASLVNFSFICAKFCRLLYATEQEREKVLLHHIYRITRLSTKTIELTQQRAHTKTWSLGWIFESKHRALWCPKRI